VRFDRKEPPRRFRVGLQGQIELLDCGRVYLEPNELVTFVNDVGKEHDFAAKDWGFYAASTNGRLKEQGYKTALAKNNDGRIYIMVVDVDRMESFQEYLDVEKHELLEWLDDR
jgi:hypothetical protein